ncbi:A/G-specific adenine glycosylase [Desertihabitans brevis]|uniref:Adenine DNA glycosylase n=1 Tax=Desertihabitans brevis TaxID=2268447 RepID=A0A367YUH2_9ACTN|nr:A/G-specific adenine glycosylase [Desertihabitans brevis]RCK69179.1 A/G-specific adenine glycosylase [Desertihabitans brevis]
MSAAAADPGTEALVRCTLAWYDREARDLPWRRRGTSPWAVLVSEFMLQQTPVARVLDPWRAWMERWPEPADLADAPTEAVLRAWGRLGYPRRALRLQAAARVVVEEHGGRVPTEHAALLALPGVGEYTAAAVASFAHRQRHVVLDTNVRRVLARTLDGRAHPDRTPTVAERRRAAAVLPEDPETAARWAVSSMELGAVVCTARRPRCEECPVSDLCRWRALGYPAWDGPPRVGQRWHGTDRQCRGALMAELREADQDVPRATLLARWHDPDQAARCLQGLLADGLAQQHGDTVGLPR